MIVLVAVNEQQITPHPETSFVGAVFQHPPTTCLELLDHCELQFRRHVFIGSPAGRLGQRSCESC